MKKYRQQFLAFLCLVLAVSLCACNNAQTPAETGTTPGTAVSSDESPDAATNGSAPLQFPLFTAEDLAAIPVASPSSTDAERREICVKYMRAERDYPWTPAKTYVYNYPTAGNADADGNLTVKKGVIYAGLPYTAASSNLYTMMDYTDPETGVITIPESANIGALIGTNCADAVFWAWARVSSSIDFVLTQYMTTSHGCLRVGSYSYDDSITDFTKHYTAKICEENGNNVMFTSYAAVRAGDGFVCYGSGGGHAILASADAVVVQGAGGIDPDQSYVLILEENSNMNPTTLSDGTEATSIGGLEDGEKNKFTFTALRKKGYIPITCGEIAGTLPVKEGGATLSVSDEKITADALVNAKINSVYRISKVSVAFTDADGNTVYQANGYGTEKTYYEYPVSNVVKKATLSKSVPAGDYTLTISVLTGNGATYTAYSGSFSK